jgi:hypothetical protein
MSVKIIRIPIHAMEAPDGLHRCRLCGRRIRWAEPCVAWTEGEWTTRSPSNYTAVHISCLFRSGTDAGVNFVRNLIQFLDDVTLKRIGFEIGPEKPKQTRAKFSVGDRVRPIKPGTDCRYGGTYREGWIFTVQEVHSGGELIGREESGMRWAIHVDEVELVEKEA